MSWWTTDVINRWLAVYLLGIAVLVLLTVAAGMRLPVGQCGHPTVRGGLCRRPVAPEREHCGIPAHRQDWKPRSMITALVTALAGTLLLAIHPLPRHDLTTTTAPLPLPAISSYTAPTITPNTSAPGATTTSAEPDRPSTADATPAVPATTSTQPAPSGGPADVGDYSRDDATAGGPAPAATMPATTTPTVMIPNMIGSSEAAARQRAADTDLPYTVVHQAVIDPALGGVVIDQDPVGGTRGRAGDSITLTVGRYTTPAPEPTSDTTFAPATPEPATSPTA